MSQHHDEKPHLPPPSLWPVGFAIGVACVLVGLVVSWPVVAVGAAITLVFGFLWVRDVTRDMAAAPAVEPETREVSDRPAVVVEDEAAAADGELEAYPRSVFLEISTLGLGAVIGGLVTLPVLGFAVLPSFTNQEIPEADLGPISNYPEGQFVTATYIEDPKLGEVSRRTVFVRYNGMLGDEPSFTILFSRCVHLGCPVQPNGPPVGDRTKYKTVSLTTRAARELRLPVPRRPVRHRGAPHRRPAGPLDGPARVLDQGRQPLGRRPVQRRHRRG